MGFDHRAAVWLGFDGRGVSQASWPSGLAGRRSFLPVIGFVDVFPMRTTDHNARDVFRVWLVRKVVPRTATGSKNVCLSWDPKRIATVFVPSRQGRFLALPFVPSIGPIKPRQTIDSSEQNKHNDR